MNRAKLAHVKGISVDAKSRGRTSSVRPVGRPFDPPAVSIRMSPDFRVFLTLCSARMYRVGTAVRSPRLTASKSVPRITRIGTRPWSGWSRPHSPSRVFVSSVRRFTVSPAIPKLLQIGVARNVELRGCDLLRTKRCDEPIHSVLERLTDLFLRQRADIATLGKRPIHGQPLLSRNTT